MVITTRVKSRIRRLRERVKYGIVGKDNSRLAQDLRPIFVIGANRSGTSLCALSLSMHPELEGIFDDNTPTRPTIFSNGHTLGYAESTHIWRDLNKISENTAKGEGMMWGLPHVMSSLYVNSVGRADEKRLINELLSARSTSLTPLIKDQANVFRIPLIKKLFPKARFVFLSRDHKSFIESCKHKWEADRETGVVPDRLVDVPHIGLHWLLVNTIALYDLKKYAPDDFIHLRLQDFQAEKSVRTAMLNRMFDFLDLDPIDIDDSLFSDDFIYVRSTDASHIDTVSELVEDLIDYELSLV